MSRIDDIWDAAIARAFLTGTVVVKPRLLSLEELQAEYPADFAKHEAAQAERDALCGVPPELLRARDVLDAEHYYTSRAWGDPVEQRAKNRAMSKLLHRLNQRTCLSCGAKTNDQGEIPCGH